jgi:4-amino-4-deoxy-L-arabinose transferase-like glycosyltransferase
MKQRLRAAATSLALLLIVALGLRVAFLWNYARHNPQQALSTIPFLFESGNIAYSLASGHGFSSPFRVPTGPTAWMTPVYPLILSGIFRICGAYTFATFIAAAGVNIFATTLACVPIFYAGRQIAGPGIAAGAAWLWAVFPNAIQIPATSMWDASIASLLVATILWATVALEESKDRGAPVRSWIGYGLLWGLALMTSATLAGLLPFLLGWLAYRARKQGRLWLARPSLAVVVAVLFCLPWAARNYRVFHAFVPLRSILGLQLWVGNNPDARDVWLGGQHPIHDAAERAKYVDLGEIAYTEQKEQDAIRYMTGHPWREAHLIGSRVLSFWSGGTPHPVEDFFRADSLWFRFVLLFNVLIAVGALAGIIVAIRRRNAFWFLLATFPAIFPWAYYLTVVLPRYSLPIDPVAMVLTALAIDGLPGIANRRNAPMQAGPAQAVSSVRSFSAPRRSGDVLGRGSRRSG